VDPLGRTDLKGYYHVRALAPSVGNLLSSLRMAWEDIDGIVTSKGPGFFTSLRVGSVFSQVMAWRFGKPLFILDSLKGLIGELDPMDDGCYLVLFDARKRQVFSSMFKLQDGTLASLWELRLINLSDLSENLWSICKGLRRFLVLYPGNIRDDNLKAMLESLKPEEVSEVEPSSEGLVRGLILFDEFRAVDPVNFVPVYLRPSDAELNREAGGK